MMDNISNAQRVGLKAVLALVLRDYSTQSRTSLKWDLCISNSCSLLHSCPTFISYLACRGAVLQRPVKFFAQAVLLWNAIFKELVHPKMNSSSCPSKPV